jgi:hypothetical protein
MVKESGRIALHNAVPPSSEKRRLLGKFDLFILNLQLFRNFGGNVQIGGGTFFGILVTKEHQKKMK